MKCQFIAYFLLFLSGTLLAEENFLLINGLSDEKILEFGFDVDKRMTPCSTFKITLSLMGFDAEILKDEQNPVWLFEENYDDFYEIWKTPQTPKTWIKNSCLWYSKVLATQLGLESFQKYLAKLEYGNQDASGGLTEAWVNSSLTISVKEQAAFLQKMLQRKLPISPYSVRMTKNLLFIDELPEGWKLFGKTGWSGSRQLEKEIGWFIGWIEKDEHFFPFAYHIQGNNINLSQRIPRVIQLLTESGVMTRKL